MLFLFVFFKFRNPLGVEASKALLYCMQMPPMLAVLYANASPHYPDFVSYLHLPLAGFFSDLICQKYKYFRMILPAPIKIIIIVYRHPYSMEEMFYPSLMIIYLSLFQTKQRNLVDVSRRLMTYAVVCKERNPS